MRVLRLTEVCRSRTSITTSCALVDLKFHATVWYAGVDLDVLAAQHGDDLLDRLAFHIAMFQLNTACSLRPDVIDLGPWARLLTPALATLWTTAFTKIWAQWRFMHEQPDYVPTFAAPPVAAPPAPERVPEGPTELLAFCGGGKDSLVALRLLERAELPFATLAYSHSVYGRAEPQHALIERVAERTARVRAERQWIIDDLLDSPVIQQRPDLGGFSLLAAETPASVFAALPLALARGYRGLVVAHEASANVPNLTWRSEEVNHQWGKSWAAEQLIDRYVREHLLANVRYFSVLAPVHDEVIFELLARDPELATLTHSCNVAKPWCRSCPKCAYVWLQFAAHLPADIVQRTFGDNLSEHAEHISNFASQLGLGEHTPFECVGSAAEAQLAFALARQRGAIADDMLEALRELGLREPGDIPDLARPFVTVGTEHGIPDHVAARVLPLLDEAARSAAARLGVR